MSDVPKSRRKPHDFKANHELIKLRIEITELAIRDFGYSKERQERKIEKFEEWTNCENKDEVVARMRLKNDSYYEDFVEEETRITRQILRDAAREFEMGNSIFPQGEALLEEYKERRLHLDLAIGHLKGLGQELNYIAEILPCDINKYCKLVSKIEEVVSLIKGVRRATNKFLKEDK